jgi:hypothetical protein
MGYELCGMRMERPSVGKSKGGEFVGRKGWRVESGRGSSGSFALERRAQDDSKNRQRRKTGNDGEQAKAK